MLAPPPGNGNGNGNGRPKGREFGQDEADYQEDEEDYQRDQSGNEEDEEDDADSFPGGRPGSPAPPTFSHSSADGTGGWTLAPLPPSRWTGASSSTASGNPCGNTRRRQPSAALQRPRRRGRRTGGSFTSSTSSPRSKGGLVIELASQVVKRDGSGGDRPRQLKIGREQVAALPDPIDRQILQMLLGAHRGDSGYTAITTPTSPADSSSPRLRTTRPFA